MPAFATLGDQDIADVVNYARRSWGNTIPQTVTAAEVAAAHATIAAAAPAPVPATTATAAPSATAAVAAGLYTAAQAAAGGQSYAQNCAVCHGAELGGGAGPALAGDTFLAK